MVNRFVHRLYFINAMILDLTRSIRMTLSMERMAQLRTPAIRSAIVHTAPASQGLLERLGFIRLSAYVNSCIDSCYIVLIIIFCPIVSVCQRALAKRKSENGKRKTDLSLSTHFCLIDFRFNLSVFRLSDAKVRHKKAEWK